MASMKSSSQFQQYERLLNYESYSEDFGGFFFFNAAIQKQTKQNKNDWWKLKLSYSLMNTIENPPLHDTVLA